MLTSELSEACFICGFTSSELEQCSRCEVRWCCPAHRDLHLDAETGACFPFSVQWTEEVGRCMVAARDIRAGEVIFRETEPLVIGPGHEGPPLCLACLGPCEGDVTCVGCGYPVCDQECGAQHQLTRECGLLARAPTPVFPEPVSQAYHPILPLRLLLLMREDAAKARMAELFMDHMEDRKK